MRLLARPEAALKSEVAIAVGWRTAAAGVESG